MNAMNPQLTQKQLDRIARKRGVTQAKPARDIPTMAEQDAELARLIAEEEQQNAELERLIAEEEAKKKGEVAVDADNAKTEANPEPSSNSTLPDPTPTPAVVTEIVERVEEVVVAPVATKPEPQLEGPNFPVLTEGVLAIVADDVADFIQKNAKPYNYEDRSVLAVEFRTSAGIVPILLANNDVRFACRSKTLAGKTVRVTPVTHKEALAFTISMVTSGTSAPEYILTGVEWAPTDTYKVLELAHNKTRRLNVVFTVVGRKFEFGGKQFKMSGPSKKYNYPHVSYIPDTTKSGPAHVETGANKKDDAPQGGASQPSNNDQDGQAQGTKPTPINGHAVIAEAQPNGPDGIEVKDTEADAAALAKPTTEEKQKRHRPTKKELEAIKLMRALMALFPNLLARVRAEHIETGEFTDLEAAFKAGADMALAKGAIQQERARVIEAAEEVARLVDSIVAYEVEELDQADFKASTRIAAALRFATGNIDDKTRGLLELRDLLSNKPEKAEEDVDKQTRH